MADPWSLLINSFTALGAIFLSFVLIYFPEHRRKRKELKTDLLLLLKKIFDLAMRTRTEEKGPRKNFIHHMIFISEAQYVEEKIRMHVKILPLSFSKEYEDLLEEFIALLSRVSSSFVEDKEKVSFNDYKLTADIYSLLQQVISGRMKIET